MISRFALRAPIRGNLAPSDARSSRGRNRPAVVRQDCQWGERLGDRV